MADVVHDFGISGQPTSVDGTSLSQKCSDREGKNVLSKLLHENLA